MDRARTLLVSMLPFLASLAAPAAGAVDLTGLWRLTQPARCTNLDAEGVIEKTSGPLFDLGITQDGSALAVLLIGNGNFMEGFVQADARKDVGRGLVGACGATSFVIQILSAKTFPAKGNGISGKMRVELLVAGSGALFTCKASFERYDVTDPMVPGCP